MANYVLDYSGAQVDEKLNEINNKAPLNSPVFTGTPTVPNPNNNSNDNSIATTKWINDKYEQIMKEVTISGNLMKFSALDGSPILKIETDINFTQNLHGYDRPWAPGGGKNLLPLILYYIKQLNGTQESWSNNSITIDGITFTINTDDDNNILGINIDGTATGDITFYLYDSSLDMQIFTDNIEYIITTGTSNTSCQLSINDKITENNIIANSTFSFPSTFNTNGFNIILEIANNTSINNVTLQPMIRLAINENAIFEPYTNVCSMRPQSDYTLYHIGLPSGYQAVEYVTLNKSIHIVTDIDFNDHKAVEIIFRSELPAQYGAIYSGGYHGEDYNVNRLIYRNDKSNSELAVNNNSQASQTCYVTIESTNNFNYFYSEEGIYKINNNEMQTYSRPIGNTKNLSYDFSLCTNGISNHYPIISYKALVIKDANNYGNKYYMALIPCINDKNIPGFYDLVNKKFYTTDDSTKISAHDVYTGVNWLCKNPYNISWENLYGEIYNGTLTIKNNIVNITVKSKKQIITSSNATAASQNIALFSLGQYNTILSQDQDYYSKSNMLLYSQDQFAEGYYDFISSSSTNYDYIRFLLPNITGSTQDERRISHDNKLQQLNTIGIPLEIIYVLKEPLIYTFTIPEIETLFAENIFQSDKVSYITYGNYFQNIQGTVNDDIINILMGIPKETSNIATQNYNINNILLVNNKLYKAITTIAQNDTLILGTNIEEITLNETIQPTIIYNGSTTATLLPCPVTYKWGEVSSLNLTISQNSQYHFMFTCPLNNATNLTLNGIIYTSGDPVLAGNTYEVDIWAGIAIIRQIIMTGVSS